MTIQRCPNCNGELPPELGQHSVAPMSGLVVCPHCGAEVKLERPPGGTGAGTQEQGGTGGAEGGDVVGADQGGPKESFSGHDSVEGVMEELESKPGDGGP